MESGDNDWGGMAWGLGTDVKTNDGLLGSAGAGIYVSAGFVALPPSGKEMSKVASRPKWSEKEKL